MKSFLYFIIICTMFSLTIQSQVFDWEWQNGKPIGVNLNDITQLPNGNYVAVGDFGTVIISTDGGATWAIAYVDSLNGNRSIYEAMFVSSTTGYACGTDGLLIKTTQGKKMIKRHTIHTIHHGINTGKMATGKTPTRQGFGTWSHLGWIHVK